MPGVIKDGTGQGFLAKVNLHNQLLVSSADLPFRLTRAILGKSFLVGTDRLPVTATKGLVAWLYNSHDTLLISVPLVSISWNGGDTNHNRVIEVDFAAGMGAPTTNTEEVVARNTRGGHPGVLSATVLGWDGVGTGMTGHDITQEVSLSSVSGGCGYTSIDTNGAILVAPKTTIGLYVRGEELGSAAFAFWLAEVDSADVL